MLNSSMIKPKERIDKKNKYWEKDRDRIKIRESTPSLECHK